MRVCSFSASVHSCTPFFFFVLHERSIPSPQCGIYLSFFPAFFVLKNPALPALLSRLGVSRSMLQITSPSPSQAPSVPPKVSFFFLLFVCPHNSPFPRSPPPAVVSLLPVLIETLFPFAHSHTFPELLFCHVFSVLFFPPDPFVPPTLLPPPLRHYPQPSPPVSALLCVPCSRTLSPFSEVSPATPPSDTYCVFQPLPQGTERACLRQCICLRLSFFVVTCPPFSCDFFSSVA